MFQFDDVIMSMAWRQANRPCLGEGVHQEDSDETITQDLQTWRLLLLPAMVRVNFGYQNWIKNNLFSSHFQSEFEDIANTEWLK